MGMGKILHQRSGSKAGFHSSHPIASCWLTKALWLMCAAIMGGVCVSFATEHPTASEYQLKAAVLFNIAKFVEWPEGDSGEIDETMDICVLGNDPFGPALAPVIGKTIRSRSVLVHRLLEIPKPPEKCEIMFIAGSEANRLSGLIRLLESSPVLTISDMDQFAERGGMVNLGISDNKINFKINPDAVSRSGLVINPQLLALATIVRNDGGKR